MVHPHLIQILPSHSHQQPRVPLCLSRACGHVAIIASVAIEYWCTPQTDAEPNNTLFQHHASHAPGQATRCAHASTWRAPPRHGEDRRFPLRAPVTCPKCFWHIQGLCKAFIHIGAGRRASLLRWRASSSPVRTYNFCYFCWFACQSLPPLSCLTG